MQVCACCTVLLHTGIFGTRHPLVDCAVFSREWMLYNTRGSQNGKGIYIDEGMTAVIFILFEIRHYSMKIRPYN